MLGVTTLVTGGLVEVLGVVVLGIILVEVLGVVVLGIILVDGVFVVVGVEDMVIDVSLLEGKIPEVVGLEMPSTLEAI